MTEPTVYHVVHRKNNYWGALKKGAKRISLKTYGEYLVIDKLWWLALSDKLAYTIYVHNKDGSIARKIEISEGDKI